MSEPIEINATDLINVNSGGMVQTVSGGIAESGRIFSAIDGSRFYYGNADFYAIYIQSSVNPRNYHKLGKIYKQNKSSFAMDISVGGTVGILNQNLAATAATVKNFMDIYLGTLSCAGGPVAWSITGMNLLVAGGKIKSNYSIYRDALEALVDNKLFFRTQMRIFYETILGELFFGRMEEELMGRAKEYLSEAVPGPKVAGKLVGVALAQIGENHLNKRLGTVKKMIDNVLLKVADHIITTKEPLKEVEQVQMLAKLHLKPLMDETGAIVNGPLSRAEEIIRETARNANTARPRLQKISRAIGGLIS